jgi:Eisosome component PIL1
LRYLFSRIIHLIISEIAEVEDNYASLLETSRQILKQIRNTESSVHPTRENKIKITNQIAHLKHKDPTSSKIMTLEQELVRAEAENLVAEAQLTNITRQKLKEAYTQQVNAVVERSEKQAILAKHAHRLLELLDDSPVVPGSERAAYDNERAAKEILLDAEEELGKWEPSQDSYVPSSRLESNLLPSLGNGSVIQSDTHSVTGDADERERKLATTNDAETSANTHDPKVLETAT